MAKELAVVQEKINTVRKYINEPYIREQLNAALPSFLNADRFLRTFFSAMVRNPALLDCTKKSMASAMIESAQLGLEPILRKAALVPYAGEVQFQPMYGGLMDLGRRTGRIKITGHVVYEKDDFDIQYGTEDRLHHKPFMGEDPGDMLGAYTVWTYEDGFQTFLFMPAHQIFKVRAVSKAWKKAQKEPNNPKAQETPWVQWEDQQSIKTVIKRHSKLQPCSIEMERAIELDNRVEMGESQADILGQFDFPTGAPPKVEPEDEGPPQHLLDKFDVKVSEKENVNLEKLSQYLALCASTQEGATINDVKASAMRKDFDKFWGFYGDWLKSQKVETEGKKEGDEDPIRKDFINLGWKSFRAWFFKHQAAIPGMRVTTQDEIREKWLRMAPEDEPYPLYVAKDDPPIEEPPDEGPDKPDEEKPEPPTMINCMMNYEDRPDKDDDGKMATTKCDEIKCDSREICVPYIKDKENSQT